MSVTRDVLKEELETIPENLLNDLYEFVRYLKYKNGLERNKIQTHEASESILAQDWNKPEEDQAWKDL
jgi:hypothetical protein